MKWIHSSFNRADHRASSRTRTFWTPLASLLFDHSARSPGSILPPDLVPFLVRGVGDVYTTTDPFAVVSMSPVHAVGKTQIKTRSWGPLLYVQWLGTGPPKYLIPPGVKCRGGRKAIAPPRWGVMDAIRERKELVGSAWGTTGEGD